MKIFFLQGRKKIIIIFIKNVCQALKLTDHIPFSFLVMVLRGKMVSQSMRNGMQFRNFSTISISLAAAEDEFRLAPIIHIKAELLSFRSELVEPLVSLAKKRSKFRVCIRISNYTEKCAKFFFR